MLKTKIKRKMKRNKWYNSVEIERWGRELKAKDSSIGRVLRLLAENGEIERQYRTVEYINDNNRKIKTKIVYYKLNNN